MKGFIELHGYDCNSTYIININEISSIWNERMSDKYYSYLRTKDGKIFLIKENLVKIKELIKFDKNNKI